MRWLLGIQLCAALVAAQISVLGSKKKTVCVSDCNGHGKCLQGLHACECFAGYVGADCSLRTCPSGKSWTARTEMVDSTPIRRECSDAGICHQETGTCKCFPGFTGQACERLSCPKDCSGHGRCLTMGEAARMFDGKSLVHRTTYDNWDAHSVRGCVCDPGFEGHDCSQMTCLEGVHPFEMKKRPEQVFMHCACDGTNCAGSVRLRVAGEETQAISLSSSATQVLTALRRKGRLFPKVAAVDMSDSSLCVSGENVTTTITFKPIVGNVPPVDVLHARNNRFPVTVLTRIRLSCECTDCDGYFRLGFQGVLTNAIRLNSSLGLVAEELEALPPLRQHVLRVGVENGIDLDPVCEPGSLATRIIEIYGQRGNLEEFSLSVSAVDSVITDQILTMSTFDGEAQRGPCNWVGTCDKKLGTCSCPAGFTGDNEAGPCGVLVQGTTSDHVGQQHCPWAVTADGNFNPLTFQSTHVGYLAVDVNESMPDSYWTQRELFPLNGSYIFKLPFLSNVQFKLDEYDVFYTYNNNATAGALALDLFHGFLFVAHNTLPGIVQIDFATREVYEFTITTDPVWSMSLFLPVGDKKYLFWTIQGREGIADGAIFQAELGVHGLPLAIHNLTEMLHSVEVVDPRGIAVDYKRRRLYWTDIDIVTDEGAIFRADIDDWASVQRISLPLNATRPNDIIVADDTVYVVDEDTDMLYSFSATEASIDDAKIQIRVSETFQQADGATRALRDPQRLALFLEQQTVWISEREREYLSVWDWRSGEVDAAHAFYEVGLKAVDVVFDAGRAIPSDLLHLECNGHGTCQKSELGYQCKCYDGYEGDCTVRTCPSGPMWFTEASGSNIARIDVAECGGNGFCNAMNAMCECAPGFYGSTCQFRQCDGDNQCSGSGACVSLRELARQHRGADGMPDPREYGTDAAGPLEWDADRVFGCSCDRYGFWTPEDKISDFVGAVCSQRPCTSTPDPVERLKVAGNSTVFETQAVLCDAIDGSLRLGFRGEFTNQLPVNTTAVEAQLALERLPTLGAVKVEGSLDCDFSSLNVTFLSFFEDLPLLQVDTTQLEGIAEVIQVQPNTHVAWKCSRHGVCNKNDGTCSCFPDWYGSDGLGREGRLWDCGFVSSISSTSGQKDKSVTFSATP